MREILTTHVGSLPRGEELVPLLLARDRGEPYDTAALERLVQTAVEDAVANQEAQLHSSHCAATRRHSHASGLCPIWSAQPLFRQWLGRIRG